MFDGEHRDVATAEHLGVRAIHRDGRQAVHGGVEREVARQSRVEVGTGGVHADVAGRELLVDRTPVEQEVAAHRVVFPAEVVEELEGLLHAVVVDGRTVPSVCMKPPRAAVCAVELPSTGVVLRHRREAGLAGLRRRSVLASSRTSSHVVGGVFGVEPGRLEQRAVVLQTERVRLAREAEDVAIGVLHRVEDDRVELVGVAERPRPPCVTSAS